MHRMDRHPRIIECENTIRLVAVRQEAARECMSCDQCDDRMPNHSSGCVRVRCSRSRKKDAGGFLAAAIGLTLHIDNGNDRAFLSLRLIAIECHYLPYPGRQGISFFEAYLAIANAGKTAV